MASSVLMEQYWSLYAGLSDASTKNVHKMNIND